MAYTVLNHMAHIAIDWLQLAFRWEDERTRSLRRYRMQIYRDVLAGRGRKPDGKDARYLPGSGPA